MKKLKKYQTVDQQVDFQTFRNQQDDQLMINKLIFWLRVTQMLIKKLIVCNES